VRWIGDISVAIFEVFRPKPNTALTHAGTAIGARMSIAYTYLQQNCFLSGEIQSKHAEKMRHYLQPFCSTELWKSAGANALYEVL
jgi:hypothetical protein